MRGLNVLARSTEGATAVEFAMLLLPFTLLLFAIIECGIAFTGQQMLAHAAGQVAREIRTGELRASEVTPDSMYERICGQIGFLAEPNCPELVIDLREFDSFADAAEIRIAFTGEGRSRDIDATGFGVTVGGSGAKQLLRVFYRWPIHMDLLRRLTATVEGDRSLLFAAVAWQNEPFRD